MEILREVAGISVVPLARLLVACLSFRRYVNCSRFENDILKLNESIGVAGYLFALSEDFKFVICRHVWGSSGALFKYQMLRLGQAPAKPPRLGWPSKLPAASWLATTEEMACLHEKIFGGYACMYKEQEKLVPCLEK